MTPLGQWLDYPLKALWFLQVNFQNIRDVLFYVGMNIIVKRSEETDTL